MVYFIHRVFLTGQVANYNCAPVGVGGVVMGVVGTVGAAGIEALPAPKAANGFGLPSLPSGVSIMLESRKELKALSEKIASSSLIFFTERSSLKKSPATEGFSPSSCVTSPDGVEEIIPVDSSGLLMK